MKRLLTSWKFATGGSALPGDVSISHTLPSLYWLPMLSLAPRLFLFIFEIFKFIFIYTFVYVLICMCTSCVQYSRRPEEGVRDTEVMSYLRTGARNGIQVLCKSINVLNYLSHFSKPGIIYKWFNQGDSNEIIYMKMLFQTHRWWPVSIRSIKRNSRSGKLVTCRDNQVIINWTSGDHWSNERNIGTLNFRSQL